jgi:hypothetical protein
MVQQGSYLEFETEICNAARFFEMQEIGDGGEEGGDNARRERQTEIHRATVDNATNSNNKLPSDASGNFCKLACSSSSSPSTVTK